MDEGEVYYCRCTLADLRQVVRPLTLREGRPIIATKWDETPDDGVIIYEWETVSREHLTRLPEGHDAEYRLEGLLSR